MSARQKRGKRSAGFTLVELMISLVMGIVVAVAAVGLARAATTTFFEQARISATEAAIRSASERLRSDLSRVSYMSTPNVQLDPKIARVPGTIGAAYRVPDLTHLQGIAVEPADTTIRSHTLETTNTLTPQDLYVAGNLSSDDVYRGTWIADQAGCGGTGGVQIKLNGAADPAVRRMYNGETLAARRQAMTQLVFMPGLAMSPQVTSKNYAVQVMDMRGCFQYLTICGVEQSTEPDTVLLDLVGDPAKGLLTPADLQGDVCGASLMEEVAVAPVGRARWYIGVETQASRNDDNPNMDGPLASTRKFNLYRQLLAADGDPANNKVVGPPEVIAEYVIDMKFGLYVDGIDINTGAPATLNIDMEGTSIDDKVAQWAARAGTFNVANVGPQRVRSVRYRLAFRAPFPDRTADLPMPSPPPYLARYNMLNGNYARVRTVMTEVAMMNQQKAVW
jgi:type II secretory pathway pseudopilin PulG